VHRIYSLDVLRGLAIFIMILVDAPPDLEKIYPILVHASWAGLTLADLAFPGFVFAMGMSAAVSMARRDPSTRKILKRAAILFALGILFNIMPYLWALLLWDNFTGAEFFNQAIIQLRVFGILQRLALTYLFAMLLIRAIKNDAGILIAAFALLILSSLGYHIYAPDNPFAQEHNISRAVDYIFPGVNHIYEEFNDPEGLYGTFASVASMLFGFLAGRNLIDRANQRDKIFLLIAAGAIFLIAGGVWSQFDIIAKRLWTAPFALITTAIEIFFLLAITYLHDKIPKSKKFLQPLCAIGMNPLFFFLLSNIMLNFFRILQVDGTGIYFLAYENIFEHLISPAFGATIFCLLWTLSWLPLAEILYRLKVVIKI